MALCSRPSRGHRVFLSALLGLLVVSAFPAEAQEGYPRQWRGGPRGWFEADAIGNIDPQGRPTARINVTVPYRSLVFVKNGQGGFQSLYRVRVVQRFGDRALLARQWDGEVSVASYGETRGAGVMRREVEMVLADPPPGTSQEDAELVFVEVTVELPGTLRRGMRQLQVTRAAMPEHGIALGNVALFQLRSPLPVPPNESPFIVLDSGIDAERFQNSNGRSFDLSTGSPFVYFKVYDVRQETVGNSYEVMITVRAPDEGGDVVWTRTVDVPSGSESPEAMVGIPPSGLAYGENQLEVFLVGGSTTSVDIENMGLDLRDDESWRANLRIIQDLAQEDEWNAMSDAAPGERASLWHDFWVRRDPQPNQPGNERLDEHFQRVAYARGNFADGFDDGALSDRGRVYVHLGPPDSIELQTMMMNSDATFELWHYSTSRLVFYFRDDNGLGRYRLVWREQQ